MTEIIIPKKNVIMDATIMNSLGCGRFYDLRFNHRFESIKGKSNSLEVGTLVHKVKEVYNRHMIKGFKREMAIAQGLIAGELFANGCPHCADFSPEQLPCQTCIGTSGLNMSQGEARDCDTCKGQGFTLSKPTCNHQPQEYPGVKNTPEHSEKHLVGWKNALGTCVEYFEFYANSHWIVLEAEVVKKTILYEDDEIRVLWKAKLDEVVDTNQGIFPCDTKTEKQRREKIRLNNQFIGQCLTMKTRNMIVDHIGFQTSLKPEEKFRREIMSYSADALLEWQSEILPAAAYKLIEMHENNYYPADYTRCENNYGNCPFIWICSSDRNMREQEIRMNFVKGLEWNPTNVEGE